MTGVTEFTEKRQVRMRAMLFDAQRGNREIGTDEPLELERSSDQLVWVDLEDPSEDDVHKLATRLSLPSAAVDGY